MQRAVDASGKPYPPSSQASSRPAASTKKPDIQQDDRRKLTDDIEEDDEEDPGGFGWAVLAFFIPIIGLVLWLVWRKTKPQPSKMSRNGFIASIALAVVVGAAAMTMSYLGIMSIPGLPSGGSSPTPGSTPNTPGATAWPDGVKTNIYDMKAGQCFNYETLQSTDNMYAWVLDCATSHDSEVTGGGDVTAQDYPTDDEWTEWSTQICDPAFQSYIGTPWYDSELNAFSVHPDAQTWSNGVHKMVCVAQDETGGLTTSLKGAKR